MKMDVERALSRIQSKPGSRLRVVDSHTCGQPTRVIIVGADLVPGTDPSVARKELAETRDWVRRVAVMEPRGHRSMFAAALIAPVAAADDYGVVFMDAHAYPDMCGHATIGVATTLVELGLIGPADPCFTGNWDFGLKTPAGRIALTAHIEAGRCRGITFQTPFAYAIGSVEIALPNGASATVEVAYGGQWYGFIKADAVGLVVTPDMIDALIAAAAPVRAALAKTMQIVDPLTGRVPAVGNIVWTGDPRRIEAHGLNVPISAAGSFDRSPCGTATCARMACLEAKEKLKIGAQFVNEGVMGTIYHARAIARWSNGSVTGIVPEVRGSAWLTGSAELSVDPDDPLGAGYLIGGGSAVLGG